MSETYSQERLNQMIKVIIKHIERPEKLITKKVITLTNSTINRYPINLVIIHVVKIGTYRENTVYTKKLPRN